jgi:glycosyl-4,4'-diaponeurosporenoate acyltransferase
VLIELPSVWIGFLDAGGCCAVQLGLAWVFTNLPIKLFNPGSEFAWERSGAIYQSVFRVKSWLGYLPDGGGWFAGGFSKGKLRAKDRDYLLRFIRETWRGELCHWTALAFMPLFFLWNLFWADVVIIAYAIAANLPCIIAQRYNRIRLRILLNHHETQRRRIPP